MNIASGFNWSLWIVGAQLPTAIRRDWAIGSRSQYEMSRPSPQFSIVFLLFVASIAHRCREHWVSCRTPRPPPLSDYLFDTQLVPIDPPIGLGSWLVLVICIDDGFVHLCKRRDERGEVWSLKRVKWNGSTSLQTVIMASMYSIKVWYWNLSISGICHHSRLLLFLRSCIGASRLLHLLFVVWKCVRLCYITPVFYHKTRVMAKSTQPRGAAIAQNCKFTKKCI
jgi:hypothetical protein